MTLDVAPAARVASIPPTCCPSVTGTVAGGGHAGVARLLRAVDELDGVVAAAVEDHPVVAVAVGLRECAERLCGGGLHTDPGERMLLLVVDGPADRRRRGELQVDAGAVLPGLEIDDAGGLVGVGRGPPHGAVRADDVAVLHTDAHLGRGQAGEGVAAVRRRAHLAEAVRPVGRVDDGVDADVADGRTVRVRDRPADRRRGLELGVDPAALGRVPCADLEQRGAVVGRLLLPVRRRPGWRRCVVAELDAIAAGRHRRWWRTGRRRRCGRTPTTPDRPG